MEFRLTFEGKIKSNGSAQDKHEIRKQFHPQLRKFWDAHPYLRDAEALREETKDHFVSRDVKLKDWLASQHALKEFKFVPMVTSDLSLICTLDILFLRPGIPGTLVQSGDIDGRMKTLFDALRMPATEAELGGSAPTTDETPFFVLLEDDKLISHVSVRTDMLLQPVSSPENINDVRLVIKVDIKPYDQGWHNINFGGA